MEQTATSALKPHALSLNRIMDVCCCYFLAAGTLTAIYKLLPSKLALPWAWAVFPALILLFLALFGRRLLLATGAGAILFLLFNLDTPSRLLQFFRAFILWIAEGYTPYSLDFTFYYYLIAYALIAIAVTVGLWLAIRLLRPFFLICAGGLALLIGLGSYGISGHNASLYLLAAGLIPLLASASVAKRPEDRGMAAAMAFPFAALCLVVAFFVVPENTESLRYEPLSNRVMQIQRQASEIYSSWQNRNVTLAAFDLEEQYHFQLGGPIRPNNTRMLEVVSDRPLLLKASVYDYYTGHGWIKSDLYMGNPDTYSELDPSAISSTAVPFNSDRYPMSLDNALGQLLDPASDYVLAPFAHELDVNVTLLHPFENRLFYTGRLQRFSSPNEIEPFVETNSELKSQQQLEMGYSYNFSSQILDRTSSGFTIAMRQLQAEVNAAAPLELKNNRQLPISLLVNNNFSNLHELALSITRAGLGPDEERSHYEQAVALENWLKGNCRYTLSPVMPPENEDFVIHFLQTQEGYCSYYASSMVIMARMLDLPARYVTGYALKPMNGDNLYQATNATAHAWVEIFIEGAGWVTFDPTGLIDFSEISPTIALSTELVDRDFYEADGDLDGGGFAEQLTRNLFVILPMLLLAILLMAVLRLRQMRLSHDLQRLIRKQVNSGRILNFYYREVLAQLKLLQWQQQQAETILGFTRRMGVYLPRQAKELQQMGMAISALRYGNIQPSPEQLQNAASLYTQFKDMLHKELKRGKYLRYCLRHGAARP